jgi:hypothetical protein
LLDAPQAPLEDESAGRTLLDQVAQLRLGHRPIIENGA